MKIPHTVDTDFSTCADRSTGTKTDRKGGQMYGYIVSSIEITRDIFLLGNLVDDFLSEQKRDSVLEAVRKLGRYRETGQWREMTDELQVTRI